MIRKLIFCLLLIVGHLTMKGQISFNEQEQLVIGNTYSFESSILNESREIWVHLPEKMDTSKKYPVIYLLDGPKLFVTLTGMLQLKEQWNIPECILVGIKNTDRLRDFTPTNVSMSRGHNTESSGGAASFHQFLEIELEAYLKEFLPIDSNSTIIGHSTAGLFVLYSYVHHPESFDNYIAIDPSLWWDEEQLVSEALKLLNTDELAKKSLYIAVANSTGVDTTAVRHMHSENTEILRANFHFRDILLNQSVDFDWDYQENEDHGSIVIPALHRGLSSIFSWYAFPERWRFNNARKYSIEELINPYYSHYTELSRRYNRPMKPDWQFLNDVGFFILSAHKAPKKALAFLELNRHYYPEEARTFSALGDYYSIRKQKKKAIEQYEIAVRLDQNSEAKEKLEALRSK